MLIKTLCRRLRCPYTSVILLNGFAALILFAYLSNTTKPKSIGEMIKAEAPIPQWQSRHVELSGINVSQRADTTPLQPLDSGQPGSYDRIFGTDKVAQGIRFPLIISPNACVDKSVFLVIYIHSAPANEDKRHQIRQSWASVRGHRGRSLVPVFLLGTPADQLAQRRLQKESAQFADIIQADFVDSYRNLTYKNLMGLEWVLEHCDQSQFVMKLDDDVLIDPYHVMNFLLDLPTSLQTREHFIYCSVMVRIGVPKDPSDKWHIPQQDYPYRYYPPYCEGFAYIMPKATASKLLTMAHYVPYFWIDDVYVTGFLPFRLHFQPTHFVAGHNSAFMTTPTINYTRRNMIFLGKNSYYYKHWETVWDAVKDLHRHDTSTSTPP